MGNSSEKFGCKDRHRVVSGEALGEKKAILRWRKPECVSKLKPVAIKEALRKLG